MHVDLLDKDYCRQMSTLRNKLTDIKCRTTGVGTHGDGGGLYLLVQQGAHGLRRKLRLANSLFLKLMTAAGGKLVNIYFTIAEGPGAIVIFDAEPSVAPAIASLVASSDGVHNVKFQRLFSEDEVAAVRQKRIQLQASYRAPGQ